MAHYNYKCYAKFIESKYNISEEKYKEMYDDPESFLFAVNDMNINPIYPKPVIMPLKKSDVVYDINLSGGGSFDNKDMVALTNLLEKKNDELYHVADDTKNKNSKDTEKIRRGFDYELRDAISDKLKRPITNAWIKMAELQATYNLYDADKDNIINTFHVCEHPGYFVKSINYYITAIHGKKHDFVFQSLKPNKDKQIFKADKELLEKFRNKLDYGPKDTGDITDPDNIKYYTKTYKKLKPSLVTSDCGLDYSKDFNKQEAGLYKVYFSAFLCAIGVSSPGSNYVFKLFSFNTEKTIELLYIATMFYERVDIVRLLSTKGGSGEIYCVCLNYNYPENKFEDTFNTLLKYQKNGGKELLVDSFDKKFIHYIVGHHKLLTARRIANTNFLIFRFLNNKIGNKYPEVLSDVKRFVKYYTDYFVNYINIK